MHARNADERLVDFTIRAYLGPMLIDLEEIHALRLSDGSRGVVGRPHVFDLTCYDAGFTIDT
jgi:hypothetical protein